MEQNEILEVSENTQEEVCEVETNNGVEVSKPLAYGVAGLAIIGGAALLKKGYDKVVKPGFTKAVNAGKEFVAKKKEQRELKRETDTSENVESKD